MSSEEDDHKPPNPAAEELPDVKLSSRESEEVKVNKVKIDLTLDLPEMKESEPDYLISSEYTG